MCSQKDPYNLIVEIEYLVQLALTSYTHISFTFLSHLLSISVTIQYWESIMCQLL